MLWENSADKEDSSAVRYEPPTPHLPQQRNARQLNARTSWTLALPLQLWMTGRGLGFPGLKICWGCRLQRERERPQRASPFSNFIFKSCIVSQYSTTSARCNSQLLRINDLLAVASSGQTSFSRGPPMQSFYQGTPSRKWVKRVCLKIRTKFVVERVFGVSGRRVEGAVSSCQLQLSRVDSHDALKTGRCRCLNTLSHTMMPMADDDGHRPFAYNASSAAFIPPPISNAMLAANAGEFVPGFRGGGGSRPAEFRPGQDFVPGIMGLAANTSAGEFVPGTTRVLLSAHT